LQRALRAQASSAQPTVNPFKDKTVVFTGALTLFTREQAEGLVAQAGGHASGSVSRNTHYLVVGEKAGSKRKKAEELGVPILTEAEFKTMLEGAK